MSCLDDDTVLRLVEGELAAAALTAVDAHLDGCTSCRDVVAQVARAQAGGGVLTRGQVVGRYVVGDLIGTGAMGRVYSAWEPELDRRVALKVLREGARDQMVREAQAMARLAHPNVVTVHEVGTVADAVFVAMELVDGDTLRTWGAARRPWREVAVMLVDVARGLAAVHAAGVVHRDIKPDNVIVGVDGRARLGDFGLARSTVDVDGDVDDPGRSSTSTSTSPSTMAAGTPPTAIAGTPAYMAPEILHGGGATAATDQFSFGVTAWELLHGNRPFAGQTWGALAAAIERDAIATPATRVPGWLDAIVRRCLAKDPARRHRSLRDVADAIAAGLAARRRPATWIATGAVIAAGATIAVVLAARQPARDPCDGASTDAAAIRSAVPAAIGAPGIAAVDRWTRRWVGARRAVCRATDAAPVVIAAQDRCLAQRAAEITALLERSRSAAGRRSRAAEASSTDKLVDALAALPAPDDCRILVGTADPIPADAARVADVRAVEAGLPAIRAATALGDARSAATDVASLIERARASGHAPTLAAALLAQAAALRGAGELDAAGTAARDAVAAAERGHDDATAAAAWIERVSVAGDRRDLAAAEDPAVLADGAVARAGDPPHQLVRLGHLRGMVAYNRGRFADARRLLEAAVIRQRELDGDGQSSVELARLYTALGQVERADGQLEAAFNYLRSALALDQLARGPQHPSIAQDLHNLAGVRRLRHELDKALEAYRAALAVEEAGEGADSSAAGLTHNSIGLVLMEREEWDAARSELDRANVILGARGHADRAMALHNLGLVDQATGAHREALVRFTEAAEIYAGTIGESAPPAVRLVRDREVSERAIRGKSVRPVKPVRPTVDVDGDVDVHGDDQAQAQGQVAGPPPDASPAPHPDARPEDVGVYGAAQKW